jgi:hypothetical protein
MEEEHDRPGFVGRRLGRLDFGFRGRGWGFGFGAAVLLGQVDLEFVGDTLHRDGAVEKAGFLGREDWSWGLGFGGCFGCGERGWGRRRYGWKSEGVSDDRERQQGCAVKWVHTFIQTQDGD